jgi:hypothetical protein
LGTRTSAFLSFLTLRTKSTQCDKCAKSRVGCVRMAGTSRDDPCEPCFVSGNPCPRSSNRYNETVSRLLERREKAKAKAKQQAEQQAKRQALPRSGPSRRRSLVPPTAIGPSRATLSAPSTLPSTNALPTSSYDLNFLNAELKRNESLIAVFTRHRDAVRLAILAATEKHVIDTLTPVSSSLCVGSSARAESQLSESGKGKGRAMSSGERSSHDKGKGRTDPQDEAEEPPAPPSDADGEGDFEDWSGF